LEELIDKAVPHDIRLNKQLDFDAAVGRYIVLPRNCAKRSVARYCHDKLSVCLSVRRPVRLSGTLVDCDHTRWNSSKIISRLISLTFLASADPNATDLATQISLLFCAWCSQHKRRQDIAKVRPTTDCLCKVISEISMFAIIRNETLNVLHSVLWHADLREIRFSILFLVTLY